MYVKYVNWIRFIFIMARNSQDKSNLNVKKSGKN